MVKQQVEQLKDEYSNFTHSLLMIKPIAISKCKTCGSDYIVRDGVINGIQRWECRACGRKFLNNSSIPGMKTPFWQLRPALFLYYEGISLRTISQNLEREYNLYISPTSIYRWTRSLPYAIRTITNNFSHNIGKTWVIRECSLKFRGCYIYIWDLIDKNTRFVLSTHVSLHDTSTCTNNLIEKAIKRAGKLPEKIITDNSTNIFHIMVNTEYDVPVMVDKPTVDFLFNNAFVSRNSILGKMKNMAGIRNFLEGWDLHYNYFKPQIMLQNRTPGEMAGIQYHSLMFQIKHKLYLSLHHNKHKY